MTDIFVQEPPSPTPMHYGSRIVLDGDYAFITTGEHSSMAERGFAQDLDKTYGKIVRGHAYGRGARRQSVRGRGRCRRDCLVTGPPQHTGRRYPARNRRALGLEHGPKGGDELNRVEKAANYGWPEVSYGERYSGTPIGSGKTRAEGFEEPRYYWDPVIAPGGFAFYEGTMFADWQGDVLASSLSPGGLVRLTLDGDRISGEERFIGDQAVSAMSRSTAMARFWFWSTPTTAKCCG